MSDLSQVSIHQSGTLSRGPSCFSQTSTRIGIKGSFFCGQECFKAGCESPTCFSTPGGSLTRASVGVSVGSRSGHRHLAYLESQKTHKVIHEIATPRQTASDGASIVNSGFLAQPLPSPDACHLTAHRRWHIRPLSQLWFLGPSASRISSFAHKSCA